MWRRSSNGSKQTTSNSMSQWWITWSTVIPASCWRPRGPGAIVAPPSAAGQDYTPTCDLDTFPQQHARHYAAPSPPPAFRSPTLGPPASCRFRSGSQATSSATDRRCGVRPVQDCTARRTSRPSRPSRVDSAPGRWATSSDDAQTSTTLAVEAAAEEQGARKCAPTTNEWNSDDFRFSTFVEYFDERASVKSKFRRQLLSASIPNDVTAFYYSPRRGQVHRRFTSTGSRTVIDNIFYDSARPKLLVLILSLRRNHGGSKVAGSPTGLRRLRNCTRHASQGRCSTLSFGQQRCRSCRYGNVPLGEWSVGQCHDVIGTV